jgi:archaellum component FlaC
MSLGGKNPLEKLEELESGIYKYKKNKDDPSSKKEGMVHYDANSHEAYPVPMTGRATGYKLLDRAFREEWGAVFDRLARFGTISVNVEPDKENLTSLKVMVDLVKERNKLVELSPSALQLVTAHMSKKKAAAFIEMINAHNKKMEAAFVTPHHAGVMDADKKAAAERAAMDAIDKQSKVVSAEIHNLNAEAHPTKDKLNESLDAVSLLAEQVNDLAKQLESKPSEELNNDHAITSIDNAMVVIRGALGAIDDAAGKGVPLEDADKVQMNDIMSSLEKAAQITANAQVNLEQNQKAAPQSPAAPSA